MKLLEEQVREYYKAQSLPEESVRSMLDVARTLSSQRRRVWLASAAAIMLMVTAIWFAIHPPAQADITQAAIAEIAKNHSKKLQPEFVTDDYQELQAQLSRVEFSILPKGDFLLHGFQLEGGRYCSVQSELAAQLKLEEMATGEDCTLYIAEATPALQKVKSDTRVVHGVRVQVWVQDGRFFGIARDASGNNGN